MRVRSWTVGIVAVTGVTGVVFAMILTGVALAQTPKLGEPVKPASAIEAAKPADPLAAMLADARAALAKTHDYTCTFTRQERLSGKLGVEQVGEMKMRASPVGVYVLFARPEASAGMEVVFSGAKKDGKVRYRVAGVAGRKGFQVLATDDHKFLADNRHPVADWGMGPIIDLITTATAREKTLNNPVEVFTADYQFASRNVTKYDIFMRRPHAFRYAARMVVYVDKDTKLPLRFEAYDDPKPGTTTGELMEAYSFTDLKFNTHLGENSFDY